MSWKMFVRVTSGYFFARLTSAPPGLRLELNFSIDVCCVVKTAFSPLDRAAGQETLPVSLTSE